jgi:hypothetical protein
MNGSVGYVEGALHLRNDEKRIQKTEFALFFLRNTSYSNENSIQSQHFFQHKKLKDITQSAHRIIKSML